MQFDPLSTGLEIIIGILCVLFLILIVNLCTFYRLHARVGASPCVRPSPRKRCLSGDGRTQGDAPTQSIAPSGYGRTQGDTPTQSITPSGYGRTQGDTPTQSITPSGDGRTQGDTPTQSITPLLSILVPARNEEKCIEECIRSLIMQDYERLEVLVLDDQSTDATASIIESIIATLSEDQRGRLQLLHGEDLPPGWVGKNFACYQLAQHARGSYLLFTDADTIHSPDMAHAVIDCIHTLNVQFLTAQPAHLMESFGERMIVPLLNFTILTLLPVALIRKRPEPSLATGNGQLLCFERLAYEKIGGHAGVKARILEDVLLARAIKTAGLHMTFVDAQEVIRCRMYRSFAEVWAGFSKNLFALYNYSLPFALSALVLNLALFVLPVGLLLILPFTTLSVQVTLLALTAYLLPVLMRVLLTLRFMQAHKGRMVLFCLLHPCSILLECLILLNAMRWHYRKVGTSWKGRYYP